MKNSILTTIALFFFTINSFSQSPNWLWAKNAGSAYADCAYSIATDNSGNVYMTGIFADTLIFGTDTLVATYVQTMYVVKYDSSGNVIWARASSGPNDQIPSSIKVDNSGNVYVAGSFVGASATFGSVTLLNPNSMTSINTFLVKYDSNGNVLWAKTNTSGGTSSASVRANAITIDNNGNLYLTGHFSSNTVTFGALTLTNAGPSFKYDAFMVKYDSNGNAIWAKRAGGTDDDYISSITTDAVGNIWVSGIYYSYSFITGSVTLINTGNTDGYIAKYDSNGNTIWAKRLAGNNGDRALSVVTDSSGNAYVGGSFTSSVCTWDTITITTPCCTSNGLMAKFNASGDILWFKTILTEADQGGGNEEIINSIALDKTGNIFVGGTINSSVHFGASYLSAQTSIRGLFIGKYDAAGNELWAKKVNGLNHSYEISIAIDTSGNLYTAGWYFDPSITFSQTTLTNNGQKDIYLAKLGNAIIPPSHDTTNIASCNNYILNGITYNSDGMHFQTFPGYSGNDSVLFINLELDNLIRFIYPYGSGLKSFDDSASYQWIDCNNFNQPIPGATNQTFIGTIPGRYAVILNKGACGPDTTICYNLNCISYYTTTYDSVSNNFTLVVDSVTAATAISYLWNFGDGTTSTLPVPPPHTYTVDTTYNVCMKVFTSTGDSCQYCHLIGKNYLGDIFRTSGFTLMVQNTSVITNTSSFKDQHTVTIYPNPFTTNATIKINGKNINADLKIIDIMGRTVKKISDIHSNEIILHRDELDSGVYFYQFTQAEESITGKFIID